MDLATVTVTFIFKTGGPWNRLSHFEGDIAGYLNSKGFQGRFIKGIGMQEGNMIILVEPSDKKPEITFKTKATPVKK